MSYFYEFNQLKCSKDILDMALPINKAKKEISESMAIIKRLRRKILSNPGKYTILDLCAGNALTSLIAAYLLPIKQAVAIDIRGPNRNYSAANKFIYLKGDIFKNCAEQFIDASRGSTILVGVHACKDKAEKIVDIYNATSAKALYLIPCCNGERKYLQDSFITRELGPYKSWCMYLALKARAKMYQDTGAVTPKNIILVAEKSSTEDVGD